MKNMKKLIAVVLAAAMVFAMSVTAFAATSTQDATGSITIANYDSTKTYTAYKIFDVTYADGSATEPYAYTIDSDSDWFSTVQSYATDANGLTLTQVGSSTTYNVTFDESNFSAAAFAANLYNNVEGKTGTAISNGTANGLDLGYWFVTTTSGSVCNLTTTHKDQTIYDKNIIEFTKDANDTDRTVEVGQVVTYTLNGKVPDTTGFTAYTYEVADSMTNGLTFNGDVEVKFDNTVVYKRTSEGTESTKTYGTYTADTNGFKWNVDMTKVDSSYVNKAITITYTATINENAVTRNIETNTATLKYSNNPADSTSTDTVTQEENLYSFNVIVDKYVINSGAPSNTSEKLAGAKFVLYKTVSGSNSYYYYDETNDKVTWVAAADLKDSSNASVTDPASAANITTVTTTTTAANNIFKGLEAGTYYLLETAAPDGYNKLTSAKTVTLTAEKSASENNNGAYTYTLSATDESSNTVTVDSTTNNASVEVGNAAGSLLPETGGMGTTIFYIVGAILVVGAGVVLITRRRMSAQ